MGEAGVPAAHPVQDTNETARDDTDHAGILTYFFLRPAGKVLLFLIHVMPEEMRQTHRPRIILCQTQFGGWLRKWKCDSYRKSMDQIITALFRKMPTMVKRGSSQREQN